MATTPRFPKVTGEGLEENSDRPVRERGLFGKALFKTFVQPSLDTISWKARQFAPKQMAFNLLSSTPIGQKLLDLKGNYDFIRDPNNAGFTNTNVSTPTNASSTDSNVAALQSTMTKVVLELQNIRRAIGILNKTTQDSGVEQQRSKTSIVELVSLLRGLMSREKFDNKEKLLQNDLNPVNDNITSGETTPGNVLGSAAGRLGQALRRGIMSFASKFKYALLGAAALLAKKLKIIKFPKMPNFKGVSQSITNMLNSVKRLIGPLMGTIKTFGKLVGRISGLGTIVLAAIDGITGFMKNFSSTEGSFYRKIVAGVDGAIQNIIIGFLEIPKTILRVLKGVATSFIDILGFKNLAESMRGFNLGEWWDNTINSVVQQFNPAETISKIGDSLVNFVIDVIQAVAKKLGVDVSGITDRLRPRQTTQQNNETQEQPRSTLGRIGSAVGGMVGRVRERFTRTREGVQTAAVAGANPSLAARADLPRGLRNNNPGNIEYNRSNNWQGQTGREEGSGRFATFETTEYGIRAIGRLLQTYSAQGHNTIRSIVNKWAPPNENDTAAYIRTMQRAVGKGPDEVLNLQDPAILEKLIRGIIIQENGGTASALVTDAQIRAGARMALQGQAQRTSTPRVDSRTANVTQQAAQQRTVNTPTRPPATSQTVNNNIVNQQNNTVASTRPPARDSSTTPVGPRS